jgi:hypothetical protein
MTRLVLFKEDYGDTLLCITDLENEQLQKVCEQAIQNDEDGIGESLDEVSDKLFGADYYIKELETSESCIELTDLKWQSIAYSSYYGFCEIVSQKGE